LIIDGASNDGSVEFLHEIRFQNVKVFTEPDNGIYDALNKGIRLSSGKIVGFLHTDDFFSSNDVLAQIADIFDDASVDGVYADLNYVSSTIEGRIIRKWRAGAFNLRSLRRGWMPPHPTLFVRREVYEKIGFFDSTYKISGDYHSILKIFSMWPNSIVYFPRVVTNMRTGGASNRTIRNILLKTKEDHRALIDTGLGNWCTVALKNLRKLPQFILA
jgi:glycosyltransferase